MSAPARLAPLIALLLTAIPASAQENAEEWLRSCERQTERSRRVMVCELRTVEAQLADGALNVDAGRNGGISARGDAAGGVQVRAGVQAHAATEARAREIAAAVRFSASDGRVQADGPRTERNEGWWVSYFITVPRRADLDLRSVNGPVTIRDVTGRIRATSTNGPMALDGLGGDVHARTENGPLAVSLSGDRWEGAGLDAETRNGPVSLRVPDGYSAELRTGTVNGPMALGFPMTIAGSPSRPGRIGRGGHMQTTLGSGGATVRVVTTNGPVAVSRQ